MDTTVDLSQRVEKQCQTHLKRIFIVTTDVQWLRVFDTVSEDLSLVPNTHMLIQEI